MPNSAASPPRIRRSPLWIGLGLAVTALPGSALIAGQGSGTSARPARAPEQIYASTCNFCHGHPVAPGKVVAPELRGRKLDPQTIAYFVRNGPGRMVAFTGSEISDVELQALASWIQHSPTPPPSGPPLSGKGRP